MQVKTKRELQSQAFINYNTCLQKHVFAVGEKSLVYKFGTILYFFPHTATLFINPFISLFFFFNSPIFDELKKKKSIYIS